MFCNRASSGFFSFHKLLLDKKKDRTKGNLAKPTQKEKNPAVPGQKLEIFEHII